jgi:hypothetical protein
LFQFDPPTAACFHVHRLDDSPCSVVLRSARLFGSIPPKSMVRKSRQEPARQSVDDAIDAFVAHQGARISPTKAKNFYGYPLRALLLPFCRQEGIGSLDELSPDAIDRFAASLYGRTTRLGKPISS